MTVTAKSTMGGTTTQNLVQKGMFIPPFEVRPSIKIKLREINKKRHRSSHGRIQSPRAKNARQMLLVLAFISF
jgi:hypothetical protein